MNCPKCNSDKGFYTTGTFYQYYDKNGEPAGYHENSYESAMAKCVKCHSRIKLSTLTNPTDIKKRVYNRKCGKCGDRYQQEEMIRTAKSPNGWMCFECYTNDTSIEDEV